MANVLVDGAIVRLTAGSDWGWGTSAPPAGTTGNYLDVTISGSGSKFTVADKATVLETDIISAMAQVTDSYHTITHGAFSTIAPLVGGADGTLLAVTLSGLTASTKSSTQSQGVVLDNVSGTFTVTVQVPAMQAQNPATSSPIPDGVPGTPKSGTWEVQDHGQGSVVLTSV